MSNSRRYPKRPLVGVGALLFQRDRILMAQRGKEPLKGWWSLPGGVLETGESLARCRTPRSARRNRPGDSVRWECSRSSSASSATLSGAPEYHYVLIDYICRVTGGYATAADDASRAAWVPRRLLPHYQITTGTLPVIEKGFRQRRRHR